MTFDKLVDLVIGTRVNVRKRIALPTNGGVPRRLRLRGEPRGNTLRFSPDRGEIAYVVPPYRQLVFKLVVQRSAWSPGKVVVQDRGGIRVSSGGGGSGGFSSYSGASKPAISGIANAAG